ncbi:amidase signature domain-containing protein [Mycena olivaceomarginata]|nr:amidase signature domain-containing protein [Mycena olivaceomarginata]
MASTHPRRTLEVVSDVHNLLDATSRTSAQLVSTGLSVMFNDVYYYISPYSSGKLSVSSTSLSNVPSVYGFKPVTVVQEAVTLSGIPSLLSNWTAIDDGMVNGSSSLILSLSNPTIPSGPYFLEMATGSLYPVYRLYDDFAGAFTEALLQTPGGTFQPLSAQIPGSASLTIGVPSRLYFTQTADKPLAGVRIGVKDIYQQLAGVKNSNGNRAWYNLYPVNEVTGTAVQRLVDAGAQIVGSQKLSQFANGEMATADWVDYHSPFNPVATATKTRARHRLVRVPRSHLRVVDAALGSDTGGSIRGPVGPSHGLVPLDHVMPLSTTLDTPGFLIRDPVLWDIANLVLYGDNYTSLAYVTPKYPTTIYTVGFPTNTSSSLAAPILNNFVDALASFVGGTRRKHHVVALLNITYATLISKEQTPLVRDPFYADYVVGFFYYPRWSPPLRGSPPLARWAFGDSLPDSALDAAIFNKTLLMDWFNTQILPPSTTPVQCLLNPRNQYFSAHPLPFGFGTDSISIMAECPDIRENSSITGHEEWFPVVVDIWRPRDLVAAGILPVPEVGGSIRAGVIS